jgi:hypothetical protein
MSATFVPPAVFVSGEWEPTESTYGIYLRNLGSGIGLSFETSAEAAALEAAVRGARLALEAQETERAAYAENSRRESLIAQEDAA